MIPWLRVPYVHDPADLSSIHMAVVTKEIEESDWRPAYRDTVKGQKYVQVRHTLKKGEQVWIRDSNGIRRAI